ncbi:MAG: methyltransferase, TIGR04325 family [Candidatus Omnitrophica bacterium]|nr:methyltransferase, TIGR04325 family [Candidatus Omnitrophota bacterium]
MIVNMVDSSQAKIAGKMKLKDILKQITPPVFLCLYRKCRRFFGAKLYTWEGIYSNYRDVPIRGEGQDGPTWIEFAKKEVEKAKSAGCPPMEIAGEQSLLAFLASVLGKTKEKIRILDFGGALGIDFINLLNHLVGKISFDYYVIESERMCQEGRRLFKDDGRIHFLDSLPADIGGIDIVHLDSALQYIDDYRGLLKRLCQSRAKYFLFVRLSAVETSTFATAQVNLPGMTLAYWFINLNEIIEIMSEFGYALIFKSSSDNIYNQDNFPERYRMKRGYNLLFCTTKIA